MTTKLDEGYWTDDLREKFALEIYGKFFEDDNAEGPRIYVREFIDLMLYLAAICISSPRTESTDDEYDEALHIYSMRLRRYVMQQREKHAGTGWNAFDMLHICWDNEQRQAADREKQRD